MEHVCEVGDIFEYPETGEYEKLRGERIVVLEKGKGCNPDHTYIRALCFRPNAEDDSFHFSCNDRYMDKVLEHWRFVGNIDISMLTEKPDMMISTEDVKKENESLKKEIEAMKEALDRQKHNNDIWKQGWFDCLKSFGYYLNS